MTPLAYLILDNAGRIVDAERPGDHKKLAASVARLNEHSEANAYRLVPVAEIPAWQPIETAPRDKTRVMLGRPGSPEVLIGAIDGNGFVHGPNFSLRSTIGKCVVWQPLPAPPKEAPDAKS